MSGIPGQSPELDEALGALREGSITPEQAARLDALLAADPAARSYYLHYIELCSTLHYYVGTSVPRRREASGTAAPPVVSDAGATPEKRERGLFWMWRRPKIHPTSHGLFIAAAIVAATLLVAGLTVHSLTGTLQRPAPQGSRFPSRFGLQELAFVLELDAVRWQAAAGRGCEEGAILKAGPLQLRSGRATLAFLSGVLMTIEGPASVELKSMERVYCHYGKVRVRVPAGAEGFVVAAPGSAFVDQGTEFALNVKEDGRAKVKVIQGATEAALLGSTGNPNHCWLVNQNEVFKLDPATRRIIEAPPDSETFASIPDFDLAPLAVGPDYPRAVVASRPRGYWRFERSEGRAIPNEIPGGAALRPTGAVAITDSGPGTRSAEFRAGDAAQCLLLDDVWLPPSEPGHAIELWFLTRTIDYASLVALCQPTEPGHFRHLLLAELTAGGRKALLHRPVSVRFLHRWPPAEVGGQNVYSANYYIPNHWYQLVVQKNGERMELYLNGKLSDSTVLDGAHATTPCRLVVGRVGPSSSRPDPETRAFVGRIDELAIYDRPLSAAEVRRHYELARQSQFERPSP